jgi:cytochrome c oxidase subunit 1
VTATRAPYPIDAPPLGAEDMLALTRTWASEPGVIGWLANVNHKAIATRYVKTAFGFFVLGGLLALVMRLQLARPEARLVGPDLYDQIFTMHGSTMMFLFAVPIMEAMGLWLVPLMIGTRNVAFPRLNAFGYLTFLGGGLLLWIGFLVNTGPDMGWFSYVPLAGSLYTPTKRADVWAQTVTFTEIAALVASVELIVTILKQRAPGMTLERMPLFVWSMLVTSFMVVFAMPAIMVASLFLATDRLVQTRFFDIAQGGDALLWQHLFWFFGHPEVYIIFIPALGMVSSIVATECRRPVVGYPVMVLSLVATAFLGFGLWVHHMFATPLPKLGESFFTAASMMIAIPTGTQIFCWIATIWLGCPRFSTSFLFVLAFIAVFTIGGLTGVMLAAVPFDLQAHDTYFVVAHFHYVLIGGAVFPLFGALYHWYPKYAGRRLDERTGRWNVALLFLGFNLTFFPMHQLGLDGMTRRIYTYLPETGWGRMNLLATVGAFTIGASVLVFLANVLWSARHGAPAGDDPWGGDSLEWATPSPPPEYNFALLPVVSSRAPLWDSPSAMPAVTGLRTDIRHVLITTALDAEPDHRYAQPRHTLWPLAAAIASGATFVGAMFTAWAVPIGGVFVLIALTGWIWPKGKYPEH